MVRRARATTLVELMVVVVVFLLLLCLILGFYVYASSITRKRDRDSARFRRVSEALDRIETEVKNARIYLVQDHQILYTTLHSELGAATGNITDWSPEGSCLFVLDSSLSLRREGNTHTLLKLEADEDLRFETGNPSSLDVTYSGPPGPQGGKPFAITRRILVDPY